MNNFICMIASVGPGTGPEAAAAQAAVRRTRYRGFTICFTNFACKGGAMTNRLVQ